ncbi:MAG: hypothetical protein WA364_22935, partial [Candidatus Nitrosopolaris sp.]
QSTWGFHSNRKKQIIQPLLLIFLVKNKHEIRMSLPLVIRTFCQISSRYKPNRDVLNCKRFAGLSSSHQPHIAGLMGMLSGQNSNANQPNIAGPIGSHTNTGKAVVMGKSYPSWRIPS